MQAVADERTGSSGVGIDEIQSVVQGQQLHGAGCVQQVRVVPRAPTESAISAQKSPVPPQKVKVELLAANLCS